MGDLGKYAQMPKDLDDKDGFKDFMVTCLEENTRRHQDLLHSAYQNVMFNYGLQWVVFDSGRRTFRPRALKKWVPRPVTNKFASTLRPLVSALISADPTIHYAPVSDSSQDVNTALVASRIVEIAHTESKVDFLRPTLARWVGLTGNAWLLSGYDKHEKHGVVRLPLEICISCGTEADQDEIASAGGCRICRNAGNVDENGNTPGFLPAMDEKNRPRFTERPRGSMYAEEASIFEIEYDHEAKTFYDSPYKIRVVSRPKKYLEDQFGIEGIGQSPVSLVANRYLESLAYLSPVNQQWVYGRYGYGDDRALVIEGWIEPCEEFPNGCFGIIVGDQVVDMMEYPYHDLKGNPVCNMIHFGYEQAPGRVAYRTVADDLIQLQRERNELQSILILHAKRSANSVWFIPDSANVSKTSGEEGLIVRYSALTNTAPPQRQAGLDIPQIIPMRIQAIDADFDAIAGTADVLRGEAPGSVRAYSAIELLDQRAQQATAELRVNWANAWARYAELNLGIFKEYAIDERTHTFMGENGQWAMRKFSQADLTGALQVKADAGLYKPTTTLARRAAFEQGLTRLGLPNIPDPALQAKGWEILGLPEMMKDMDLDQQHACKENDAWLEIFTRGAQMPQPTVLQEVDNHPIHIQQHRRFALTDTFQGMPDEAKRVILAHIASHKAIMFQEMQQQMMAQRPPQQPSQTSEGQMRTAEGGAASQPARANALTESQPA